MKQGQFNHLRLDNFSSLCSDYGFNVKRIRKRNEANKENTIDTPNYLSSMCGSVVGVGGFSIRSSTSAPTIRCPLSNISNSNNEKSGSSNVDLIEEKLGISNSGKANKYQKVVKDGTNILRNSSHHNFGVDGDLTCPPLSCVTTRVPLSNISNRRPSNEVARGGQFGSSSLLKKKEARIIDKSKLSESSRELFGLPKERIFEEETDVDYNLDVASGQTAFLEEDDEMFYDGEMLYGTDSDEEDIVFGEKWCLTKEGYASLGPPSSKCSKCDAIMWKEERVNKQVTKGTPEFSLCCGKGQIKLPKAPSTPSYLMQLYNDPHKCHKFKKNIRLYNTMFAFTSMGGKVDHSINTGRAPYIYRLNGQNHHVFGSLLPNDNETPKFCQLYIYDTESEVENRMKWVNVDNGEEVDVKIVQSVHNTQTLNIHHLSENNPSIS